MVCYGFWVRVDDVDEVLHNQFGGKSQVIWLAVKSLGNYDAREGECDDMFCVYAIMNWGIFVVKGLRNGW